MKSTPTVTVVMTSYNYERFLDEAIQSVVAQTWTDWEMIVVDDQSTDGSWSIIERWTKADRRIAAVRPSRRLGFVGALNLGMSVATGQFIAIIDSDDVWSPQRLEQEIRFLQDPAHNQVGVCGANCLLIDEHGREVGRKQYPLSDPSCPRAWWYRNPFYHSATLIRRACFDRYGLYDERFPMAHDLDLWFRFGQGWQFHNLPDYLVKYRISGFNASLRRQKALIRSTIAARRWAAAEYGYTMDRSARLALGLVWCAQWLPASLVHRLFHRVFLRVGARLWREPGSAAVSEGKAAGMADGDESRLIAAAGPLNTAALRTRTADHRLLTPDHRSLITDH